MLEAPFVERPIKGCRAGDHWTLEQVETISRTDGSEMLVLQVRNGIGLRMGWAFVCSDPERGVSEVRELYVMPPFRKQGIGSFLEERIVAATQSAGLEEVHVALTDADKVLNHRAIARSFAARHGYTWRWRAIPRLRADAIAVKKI